MESISGIERKTKEKVLKTLKEKRTLNGYDQSKTLENGWTVP